MTQKIHKQTENSDFAQSVSQGAYDSSWIWDKGYGIWHKEYGIRDNEELTT